MKKIALAGWIHVSMALLRTICALVLCWQRSLVACHVLLRSWREELHGFDVKDAVKVNMLI